MDKKLLAWIYLTMVFTPGNADIHEFLIRYGSNAETAFDALISGDDEFLGEGEKRRAERVTQAMAESVAERCEKDGVKIICLDAEEYPRRLAGIYNPPPILFVRGSLECIDSTASVAMVGARDASQYSVSVADRLSKELAATGMTIVSGFAVGIDHAAHCGAMSAGGKTVAVLGCGMDYDYPKAHFRLKDKIAENGAVVSEFFPGTPANRQNFPSRNRIISGLSLGVCVVEAGRGSGSLVTAKIAQAQGRQIFCVPPSDIFDERYVGQTQLLREGAIPVMHHIDILYEYYENYSHTLNFANPFGNFAFSDSETLLIRGETETTGRTVRKRSVDCVNDEGEKKTAVDLSGLSENQAAVVRLLDKKSMLQADEIAAELNADIGEILLNMTELELLGYVAQESGKRYRLV